MRAAKRVVGVDFRLTSLAAPASAPAMSEARGIMASVVLASAATVTAGVLVVSLLPARFNTLLMKGTVLCAAGARARSLSGRIATFSDLHV